MDLVVGASESTLKSLLGKLGSLLAKEYTLIRGVGGDLQFIADELRTMQSFLRDLGDDKHDYRTDDWRKQIRDMTYDVEDCIDDSGNRIHTPCWLRSGIPCYFLVNSVYEVVTWWPRRDIATKISDLKARAEQIADRRQRYGVDNPKPRDTAAPAGGFDAAANQDRSLQLVTLKEPVGVNRFKTELEHWVRKDNKFGVLAIVGIGGVGKTTIATDLYRKFGDLFDHRVMVTVSQNSDVDAILENIRSQVKPRSTDGQSSEKSCLAAMFSRLATLEEKQSGTTKRQELIVELSEHFKKNSYLVLMDDVWSASTWEDILKAFPEPGSHSKKGRVIVTTRFPAVATVHNRQEGHCVHNVNPLDIEGSKELFERALSESKSSQDVQGQTEPWKICGGLPLAIVAMAGYAACHRAPEWLEVYKSLFPENKRFEELSSEGHHNNAAVTEAGKDTRKGLTHEELSRIVSYCHNDMPAEIITCSLYLSIFPKGSRISRKRLIRRWIAEGFVSEKDGMSVEDVAETYFSHLVKRKMIRPVEHSSSGKVKQFVVHDMVLQHIVSKASEENFIIVVGGHWLIQPPSSKVRRLSLQGSDHKLAKDMEKMNLSHVRSLTMFESMNQLPSHLFKFGIVQVLDLEGCKDFKENNHMKQICRMLLLKYLSLRRTDTKELPETIGKLQNLETLDVRETKIVVLPRSVGSLGRLVNILGGNKEKHIALKLPEEFVKKKMMKVLKILKGIEIVWGSDDDLSHLSDLRKLAIYELKFRGDVANSKLKSSIQNLCSYSLRTLVIHDDSSEFLKCLDEMTSPPRFLTALELSGKMDKLPDWIAKLNALTKLTLSMTLLRTDYLRDLSKLNTLFSLTFTLAGGKVDPETMAILAENKLWSDGEIVFPDVGFESLKLLRLFTPLLPLLSFSENGMPKLERLEVEFNMLEGIIGTENLAGLNEVYLKIKDKDKYSEAMAQKVVQEMNDAMTKKMEEVNEAKTKKIVEKVINEATSKTIREDVINEAMTKKRLEELTSEAISKIVEDVISEAKSKQIVKKVDEDMAKKIEEVINEAVSRNIVQQVNEAMTEKIAEKVKRAVEIDAVKRPRPRITLHVEATE